MKYSVTLTVPEGADTGEAALKKLAVQEIARMQKNAPHNKAGGGFQGTGASASKSTAGNKTGKNFQGTGPSAFKNTAGDKASERFQGTGAHITEKDISAFVFRKKSLDARRNQIKTVFRYDVYTDGDTPDSDEGGMRPWLQAKQDKQVIIIGDGPAGLFAALRLLEDGIKPVIIERGPEASQRKRDIADISRTGSVHFDSNYCFGEGGAGTFSDGKLFSRSNKRGNISKVLEIFAFHGAPASITTDAHPHIGTDKLPAIIGAMNETIRSHGGEVHFNMRCTLFIIEENGAAASSCINPDKAADGFQGTGYTFESVTANKSEYGFQGTGTRAQSTYATKNTPDRPELCAEGTRAAEDAFTAGTAGKADALAGLRFRTQMEQAAYAACHTGAPASDSPAGDKAVRGFHGTGNAFESVAANKSADGIHGTGTNMRVTGIIAEDTRTGTRTEFRGDAVILATGHSAPDMYEMLAAVNPASLEAKTFAAGVRVEHPRKMIDRIQYHGRERGENLPAAEYRLVTQVNGRGVYSFCMCPGGLVVPSASAPGGVVVNGMSPSSRNARWSNAAIVVELRPEDYATECAAGKNAVRLQGRSAAEACKSTVGAKAEIGFQDTRPAQDPLAGLRFRTQMEQAAYAACHTGAPASDCPAGDKAVSDFHGTGCAFESVAANKSADGFQDTGTNMRVTGIIAEDTCTGTRPQSMYATENTPDRREFCTEGTRDAEDAFTAGTAGLADGVNPQAAPAQRLTDFLEGRLSKTLPESSYTPGLVSARLDLLLPEHISTRLKQAFRTFDKNMKGFICDEALLIAPETRTSTPVRILRDKETLESPVIKGLYPAGEGSGYAGGITSSAMDGEKAAAAISGLA